MKRRKSQERQIWILSSCQDSSNLQGGDCGLHSLSQSAKLYRGAGCPADDCDSRPQSLTRQSFRETAAPTQAAQHGGPGHMFCGQAAPGNVVLCFPGKRLLSALSPQCAVFRVVPGSQAALKRSGGCPARELREAAVPPDCGRRANILAERVVGVPSFLNREKLFLLYCDLLSVQQKCV